MPTMSRGTSFKAGFLYGAADAPRRRRRRAAGGRHDGPKPGGGSRSRPRGRRLGLPDQPSRARAGPRNGNGPVTDGDPPESIRRVAARPAVLVRKGGLEPPRVAPLAPKTSASTDSATFASADECAVCRPGAMPGNRCQGIAITPPGTPLHSPGNGGRGGAGIGRRRQRATVDSAASGWRRRNASDSRVLAGKITGVWLRPPFPRRPLRSGPTPGTRRSSARPPSLPGRRGSSAGSGAY